MLYDFIHGLISYRRENRWLMYSYLYLILSALAWLDVIHPPSIFTLSASPVVFLRRRCRLSLRMSIL